ncbi:MAG TPA: EthD domain-containing protein [Acidimicrobiales bacterium]
MIKLVFVLRRRSDLTREEFQRHWLDRHAPLVRSYADVLGIRRYVQTHTLPDELHAALRASRGAPEPYDGVAELWYDDLEALAAAVATDEGRAAAVALLDDERRFIDHDRSPLWLAREHPIVPGGA